MPKQQKLQPLLVTREGDLWFTSLAIPRPWPPAAAREARIDRFYLLVSTLGDCRMQGLRITEEATVTGAWAQFSISPPLLPMVRAPISVHKFLSPETFLLLATESPA